MIAIYMNRIFKDSTSNLFPPFQCDKTLHTHLAERLNQEFAIDTVGRCHLAGRPGLHRVDSEHRIDGKVRN